MDLNSLAEYRLSRAVHLRVDCKSLREMPKFTYELCIKPTRRIRRISLRRGNTGSSRGLIQDSLQPAFLALPYSFMHCSTLKYLLFNAVLHQRFFLRHRISQIFSSPVSLPIYRSNVTIFTTQNGQ